MDSWDDIAAALRDLRTRAGNPSYSDITTQVRRLRADQGRPEHVSRTAVYDCFTEGRVRMDLGLLDDLGAVLGLSGAAARDWTKTCFAVQNRVGAAQIVTVDPAPHLSDGFVGRDDETARVAALDRGLVAITGLGGVGKTRLATQAAHLRVREGRSRRILLVDLRGYDDTRPAADPAAVRNELLRALGADLGVRRLPVPEQQARLDGALAAEQCVLILDDAASAAQIRAVVGEVHQREPVLVTSRHLLDDLGGDLIALGPLPADDAVTMLGAAGYPIADADRPAAAELASMVGHHPMALELTAHRLAERPQWPLAEHAAAIRSQHELLHLPQPVSASLELSLVVLEPTAGLALRLFAEQPCGRLPVAAVGALLGEVGRPVDDVVADLVGAHLVGERADGLVLHDLVRLAARAWGLQEDAPSTREAARRRLLEHYVVEAEQAVFATSMLPYAVSPPLATGPESAAPTSTDRAWAWLATERDNLLAVADPEHAGGYPEVTTRMSSILGRYLEAQGHYPAAVVLHRWAVAVAARRGDRRAEVDARGFLAAALARLGESEEALAEVERVLATGDVRETADAVATARNVRGVILVQRGELDDALAEFRAALEVVETGQTVRPRSGLLGNIGAVLTYLGRIPEAITHQQQALEQALVDKDWDIASSALTNLVDNHLAADAPELALEAAQQAFNLTERYGINTALVSTNLGVALTAVGRYDDARAAHQQGLVTARETGDPDAIAAIRNNLADTELAAGDREAARAAYAAAQAVVLHDDGLEGVRARAGLAALSISE